MATIGRLIGVWAGIGGFLILAGVVVRRCAGAEQCAVETEGESVVGNCCPGVGETCDEVREQLLVRGFAMSGRVAGSAGVPGRVGEEFAGLAEDPHSPGSGRYRAYSRMLYLPWRDSLEWMPEEVREGRSWSPYDQGSFNREFPGMRYFPGISAEVKGLGFLEELVRADLGRIPDNGSFSQWPVYVGVHLIRLQPGTSTGEAGTTPDHLHQDGGADMFTFVHLVGLSNAEGGETTIAKPECAGRAPHEVSGDERLADFKLEEALQWYAVNDQAVSHHAAAIRRSDPGEPARRDVVLLGISPCKPVFG